MPTEMPKLRPLARGKEYYTELNAILSKEGDALKRDFEGARARKQGRVTPRDVCFLALKYKLNLKATFDFLEDEGYLAYGTYAMLKERGLRSMAALREVWDEIQGPIIVEITEVP